MIKFVDKQSQLVRSILVLLENHFDFHVLNLYSLMSLQSMDLEMEDENVYFQVINDNTSLSPLKNRDTSKVHQYYDRAVRNLDHLWINIVF